MMRVLIVGAGGHAQVIADAIKAGSRHGEPLDIAGFLDDNPELQGNLVLQKSIVGPIGHLRQFDHDAVIIGIGDNVVRGSLFSQLHKNGERFISVVHPRAVVADDVELGDGVVVFAGAVVNTGSIIGPNVIVNTGATVDHHANLGAHVHIAPGAHLGGTVTVGEGALIGIGSIIMPGRSVREWATVGAGAVVTKDVGPGQTVVGVPAKPLVK